MRRTQQIETFFASLAHEFRTPLTSMRLQIESLRAWFQKRAVAVRPSKGERNWDAQEVLVQRLLQDTIRLESQIERTLSLAALTGGGALALLPIDLDEILQKVCAQWSEHYPGQFEFTLELNNSVALVDELAVGIIFKNLIENALRHSQRSLVHLSVRTVAVSDGFIGILFQDNGQGFEGPRHQLGQLFFRGRKSQGVGVGLYLIASLMKAMGGQAQFGQGKSPGF